MRIQVDKRKTARATESLRRPEAFIKDNSGENFFITTWRAFTKNSSVHAVHYLTEPSMKMIEKLFWLVVIFLASLAMAYCCLLLSSRFRSSLTSTVFESTNFKITEIPFPAVTLCNSYRLNYDKTQDALDKFLINGTEKEKQVFLTLINVLQTMDYGSYDEFAILESDYRGELDHLNVSEIYRFMMHECEDFFIHCSWRGKKVRCCEIFSIQVTEYGLCFSFNSFTNEGTTFINRTKNFPWRVANIGKDSALKVIVNSSPEKKVVRENSQILTQVGVVVIVQHPHEHPNNGQFIAVKSITSLIIKPTTFSTSDDVNSLIPADRQCYYDVSE
jgi:hypothetical protein